MKLFILIIIILVISTLVFFLRKGKSVRSLSNLYMIFAILLSGLLFVILGKIAILFAFFAIGIILLLSKMK